MPTLPHAALIILGAYLLGSIPFGLLAGWLKGIDIREHGSRNIGATNVWRIFGWRLGLPTFLCDVGKGLVGVLLAEWLGRRWGADPAICGILAAIGCILGHTFPIWLRFRGGKGVATSLGVLFGVVPIPAALTFAVWFTIFKLTRYVSLASIIGAISLPVWVFLTGLFLKNQTWAAFYFTVAATILVIVRHTGNIKRLVAGTENRFGTKSAATPESVSTDDGSGEEPPPPTITPLP